MVPAAIGRGESEDEIPGPDDARAVAVAWSANGWRPSARPRRRGTVIDRRVAISRTWPRSGCRSGPAGCGTRRRPRTVSADGETVWSAARLSARGTSSSSIRRRRRRRARAGRTRSRRLEGSRSSGIGSSASGCGAERSPGRSTACAERFEGSGDRQPATSPIRPPELLTSTPRRACASSSTSSDGGSRQRGQSVFLRGFGDYGREQLKLPERRCRASDTSRSGPGTRLAERRVAALEDSGGASAGSTATSATASLPLHDPDGNASS